MNNKFFISFVLNCKNEVNHVSTYTYTYTYIKKSLNTHT